MTDLIAPFDAEPVQRPADVEAPPRTPVLITEQQVLFATAAAVPLRPTKTRWIDNVRAVLAAFVLSGNEKRPTRRHYPPRADFLEDSRMAREMMRL
ncbi:hypothetical protein [Mycobacterium sp. 3519A]|jgi:hypothetical protein|uniref:hypothetical protein n=1 Tax=Mycobacterium sp. 3519A TaxID=2057184 RepID=UPI000C7D4970|nr:hypothetical protein [Mycobacterium sp. 3519A]